MLAAEAGWRRTKGKHVGCGLRGAVDGSPKAAVIIRFGRKIAHANTRATECLGWSVEVISGIKLNLLVQRQAARNEAG
jgi:hypothetical protein